MPRLRRLRIALVAGCPFPWARGTPARILGMAQALHDAGHEVHVVAYPLGELDRRLPFRVHRSAALPGYRRTAPGADPLRLAVLLPLLAVAVGRVARRHDIDIIHAHHYEGLLAARPAKRLHRVPVIYDAHTTLAGELPYYRHGLPRRLTAGVGRALDRRLPRLADHIVATSQYIAHEMLDDGMAADRVTVIGNGIEDDFVAAAAVEPGSAPAAAGAGERIVYAGNLAGYQGIETLLRAFAVVAARRPAARLQLITESVFEPYAALARQLGVMASIDLETPPPPHALGTRLAEADVLVNPRAECPGYPLKLLNYMAAGRAIVSFAASARDLTHGSDAWLVDQPSPEALAGGLTTMLDRPDLARRLGVAARRRVVEELTWSRVAVRLESVYKGLLKAEAVRRSPVASTKPAALRITGSD